MATGCLCAPNWPRIEGLERFAGPTYHTALWPHERVDFSDLRVAVIGTGASAIQIVPRVARDAGHVYLFQRTPSTVGLRLNSPTDPEWFASLEPGWQDERRENFAAYADGRRPEVDLVDDSWTAIFRAISSPKGKDRPKTREERNRIVELHRLSVS